MAVAAARCGILRGMEDARNLWAAMLGGFAPVVVGARLVRFEAGAQGDGRGIERGDARGKSATERMSMRRERARQGA